MQHAALFQVSSYVDINSLEGRHTHTCITDSWRKVISKNPDKSGLWLVCIPV